MPTPVSHCPWRPILLAMMLGLLSACTLTQQAVRSDSSRYALTRSDPSLVSDEDTDEAEDALDVFLTAPIYRSPDYTLRAEVKPSRMTRALETALSLQGTPYRMGGNDPDEGLDCSGFVKYSFSSIGIELPRTSREMYHATERVSRNELQPGDLLFFKTGRRSRSINHVAIYLGNGRFIHAPRSGRNVSIDTLERGYWRERFVAGGRIEGLNAEPLELSRQEEEKTAEPSSTEETAPLETAAAAGAPAMAASLAPKNPGAKTTPATAKATSRKPANATRNAKTNRTKTPVAKTRTPPATTRAASRSPASSPSGQAQGQTGKVANTAKNTPATKPQTQAKANSPVTTASQPQPMGRVAQNDR